MRKTLYLVIVALILPFLISCASTFNKIAYKNYKPGEAPGKGIIVATVSEQTNGKVEQKWFPFILCRKIDNKNSNEQNEFNFHGSLASDKELTSQDVYEEYEQVANGEEGTGPDDIVRISGLNVFEVPAGEYEIFGWLITIGCNQFGCTSISSQDKMSIKFTVNENEVFYLGEIRLKMIREDQLLGKILNVKMDIMDSESRDKKLVEHYFKNIDVKNIKSFKNKNEKLVELMQITGS